MSTIVVKNFPDELHGRLRQRAERNHRSMTKEVVHLIAAGLGAEEPPFHRPPPPPVKLKNGTVVTSEELKAAIADHSTGSSPISDGREALRSALIRQPDGSYVNVLGIEDDGFFDALDRVRTKTPMPDMSHHFDNTP